MKLEIKVYDPPMCCSSGVCGTSVNPELVRFSNDLKELERQGVNVERFNLSTDPAAFVADAQVKETLTQEGNDCLPLILANGKIIRKGGYPAREELMKLAGIEDVASPETADVAKPESFSDCGPGCSCNCAPSGKKMKSVISAVVLIAVLGILGVKFATAKPAETAAVSASDETAFPVGQMVGAEQPAATEPSASVLEKLNSLGDLNTVAISQDAVLVFIPDLGNADVPAATESAMRTAQKTLQKSRMALGLYSLAETSPEYRMISAQANPPAILVAAKGRGMLAIPAADVTETKILQAFMAASSAGGCGAGGCGPSAAGCN